MILNHEDQTSYDTYLRMYVANAFGDIDLISRRALHQIGNVTTQ